MSIMLANTIECRRTGTGQGKVKGGRGSWHRGLFAQNVKNRLEVQSKQK